ncbi:ShlB/FhaC/HecB family hemolysin secretion/activation protein [Novosphingobium album (ex Liu et al. 2023)]|uniref:ShlB/FhaC/HecB family hemolysin secretion/activation protein n=1 Tax=Novosphingobium album (ex Liu et al. 2023) TaxID=3031130 RepID=A0ABT5WKE4_9SPHN|nr:ShlB/FhaC/HecB family hemolysin secretion/activation protein [Novosphingobium album (ex Liu et al. 2023)]MDE8650512.1 ShlB/FhaC/HecB family hemolysin secretion/activation protein [Novosphingobium album (ex Liu et al. 2023)]
MRRRFWLALGCALLQAGVGQGVFAQPAAEAISQAPTIDRDRVDRQDPAIPPPPAPAQAPRPQATIDEAPAGIVLARLRYEGSTLPRERLDAALAPYIGQPLTRDTLQKIVNTISGVYNKSNVAFYSVTVPRQVVSGGELTVRVLEGRIAQYALARETPSMPTRLIGAQVARLMRDQPTHKDTLERTLSLLRDIPGQTVDAQLKETGKPGDLALGLDVKRKQLEVTLNVNNRGVTNVISGVQAQLSVAVNGLLREGDATQASAYLPFQPNRYQFYSASHSTPLGSNGTRLSVSGAYVRTLTKITNIRGEAKQAGIGLSHPLIRSYRKNLSLGLSLDGTDTENYFLDTAFGGFRTRAVRFSTTWSAVGKTGGYAVAATLSHGLDALGARPFVGFSEAGFAKANVQLTAAKELSKAVGLRVTARGQYSADKLPTTERFSLGGEGAGLAYRVGTLTAERAVAASAELSWKPLGAKTGGLGPTVFAYADGALAHTVARPHFNLPAKDYSLASAGVGARISPFKGWTANVQIAIPVKRPFDGDSKKARVLFSINRVV